MRGGRNLRMALKCRAQRTSFSEMAVSFSLAFEDTACHTKEGPNGYTPAALLGLEEGRRVASHLHFLCLSYVKAMDGSLPSITIDDCYLPLLQATPGSWMPTSCHPQTVQFPALLLALTWMKKRVPCHFRPRILRYTPHS